MKYLFALFFLLSSLYGDVIKNKTLGCPSVLLLEKAQLVDMQDPLKLEMYAIANSCVILSRGDSVEAIGYDPRNSKEIYQQIFYKKTSTELYILRKAIHVEQGGKKNTYRF